MNQELVVVSDQQDRIWWICSAGPGHVWQADATSGIFEGNECPCCAGRPHVDLEEQMVQTAAPPPSRGAIPSFIRRGWWMCRRNPEHLWYVKPDSTDETNRPYCPFCSLS